MLDLAKAPAVLLFCMVAVCIFLYPSTRLAHRVAWELNQPSRLLQLTSSGRADLSGSVLHEHAAACCFLDQAPAQMHSTEC